MAKMTNPRRLGGKNERMRMLKAHQGRCRVELEAGRQRQHLGPFQDEEESTRGIPVMVVPLSVVPPTDPSNLRLRVCHPDRAAESVSESSQRTVKEPLALWCPFVTWTCRGMAATSRTLSRVQLAIGCHGRGD